jgi:transposase
VVREGSG